MSESGLICAEGDRKPAVDEEGLVHWPVMFVYPETMQTDAVEDFVEADSLQQHLDAMFSPDAPPLDWDDEHQYTRDRLRLYYLSHAARPLPLEQLTEVRARNAIVAVHSNCKASVVSPCQPAAV